MNHKIFIIGGAGYIGSHMVKALSLSNYEVITIDNLSTGHADAVLYGKLEVCDIRNEIQLDLLFKKYKPEAVIHLGAFSIISESFTHPQRYFENNVNGTKKLLEVMLKNGCKNIVFSSTAAVFGNPEYIPIDENHKKEPTSPYGHTKLIVERMLDDFSKAHKLSYIVFRYFNAVGQDNHSNLKERHDPETHLLPLIVQTLKGIRENVTIYGTDYDTDDGSCVRDYIHVNDICLAHLKGVERLMKKGKEVISEDYNLGCGRGFSVKEVIIEFKNITKLELNVNYGQRRQGDPPILIACNKKASKKLGFTPVESNLKEIIKSLI